MTESRVRDGRPGQPASPAEFPMSGGASLRAKAARGAAWSGLSTIVLRLGSLVVGIIMARLLTPEQFGVYAVALTVQSILITVADLGLSADLIRTDRPERIAPTVATLGLTSGALMTVATMVSSTALAGLLGSADAAPAIAVLSFTLLLAGASVVPYALLQRRFQQRADVLGRGRRLRRLDDGDVDPRRRWGFGVMGLAIGRVAAQIVSSTMQFVFARVKPRYGIDRTVVRPVLAFGLPIAAANLLSWALLNVDNIVLARVAGATALGYYVLAFNISSWPMSALSQVVRSISLPYFARTGDGSGGLAAVTAVAWAGALPAGAVLGGTECSAHRGRLRGEMASGCARACGPRPLRESSRRLRHLRGIPLRPGTVAPVLWIQIVSLVALVVAMIFATHAYGIVGAGWAHVAVAVRDRPPGAMPSRCGARAFVSASRSGRHGGRPSPRFPSSLSRWRQLGSIGPPCAAGRRHGALVVYGLVIWPWLRPSSTCAGRVAR